MVFSFFTQITGRLEAMLLEAKGSWGEAEKAYSSLLEDNPFDQVNFCNQFFLKCSSLQSLIVLSFSIVKYYWC